MRVLLLALALFAGSCEREVFWKMDGDILVVDNNALLQQGPVLRCLESANLEYLCEAVYQQDGALVERGDYVRTSRVRSDELRQHFYDALGRPPETRFSTEWDLDGSTRLVQVFSDYYADDGDKKIVRFMLPEYAWWLISPTLEPFPYPVEQTVMEASIRQVLLQRCGDDLPVDVGEAALAVARGVPPYQGYSGSAGPMTLRSYEGVYWEATGTCTAVEANRGARRLVP